MLGVFTWIQLRVSTRKQVCEYKCFSQCQLPPWQWQKGRESLESTSHIPRESRTLNVHFPKLVLHGKISCFLKWLVKGGNTCPRFAGLSDIYMFVHSMSLSTHSGRTEEESMARTAHTESKQTTSQGLPPHSHFLRRLLRAAPIKGVLTCRR